MDLDVEGGPDPDANGLRVREAVLTAMATGGGTVRLGAGTFDMRHLPPTNNHVIIHGVGEGTVLKNLEQSEHFLQMMEEWRTIGSPPFVQDQWVNGRWQLRADSSFPTD